MEYIIFCKNCNTSTSIDVINIDIHQWQNVIFSFLQTFERIQVLISVSVYQKGAIIRRIV